MPKQGESLVRDVCAQVAREQGGTSHEASHLPRKPESPPEDMTESEGWCSREQSLTPGEWDYDRRPIGDGDSADEDECCS